MTPNRIVLIGHGRYDEIVALAANLYPGMLVRKNSSGQLIPHNTIGVKKGPTMVITENALLGVDITNLALVNAGDPVRLYYPVPGDKFLMLLQNGQNVAVGDPLMSAGDGTLIEAQGGTLYDIVAASTGVTNTNTETVFSNGSYSVPANTLSVGDIIRIKGQAVVSAQNSTNTHDVKIELGSSHTVIGDSGAVALAATQYVEFDISLTIRTIGASGTYVGSGTITTNPGGTVSVIPVSIASATLDTTVAELIRVTVTASAASTGNVCALQEFSVLQYRTGSTTTDFVAFADEAINNSAGAGSSPMSGANTGTAAFIRCMMP